MSIIANIAGAAIGLNLINGKIKPKKKGVLTYIALFVIGLLVLAFTAAFIYGLVKMNIEFIIFGAMGALSFSYLWLISPYTQNSNNYFIKVKNPNSFEGFELYYKQKNVKIEYAVDNEGKFKWANDEAKLECISYCDSTKMSNFTKYRIINYFSAWLLSNNYLSNDVTMSFEKL